MCPEPFPCKLTSTMNPVVNRSDRDALVEVINEYLEEKINAFTLDERLSKIEARTDDPTVQWVRAQLWYCYDDCKDHQVVGDKAEWDLIQRLLLLLKSDASVVVEVGPAKWAARQAVAALCLIVAGWTVWRTGWGEHLLITNIPLGVISMCLAYWRRRAENRIEAHSAALVPFGSVAQLRSLRRTLSGVVKRRYPGQLAKRRIRSPAVDFLLWLQFGALWLMFSPVALLFQLRPERTTGWRVVTA